jgi:aspartyl-tRNA(Asn)/glutamyl-tRNA(Gln) amidotransferase subunit A
LSLVQVADEIRKGRTSPTEIVEILLQRIREIEPRVKAYLTVCEKASIQLAKRSEKELKRGHDRGPLHGLPISVKDLFDTAGIRTTYGSRGMRNNVPRIDSTVVRKLKEAGMIVIGKTNTDEFAMGKGVTPPTRNPWNLHLSPGGSSGGSAAAVAAFIALASVGSDTGGSIRTPSSFCGTIGLKPSYSLVSRYGLFPASWTLDHVGPITRYVEDAALLLSAIAGYDIFDPCSSRVPLPDYLGEMKKEINGLRIGVPKNHFFDSCERDVRKGVWKAIDHLQGLGCKVVEFRFPHTEEMDAAMKTIDLCESSSIHKKRLEDGWKFRPDVRLAIEQGLFISANYYIQALRLRTFFLKEVQTLFKDFDVIVTPTEPIVAKEPELDFLTISGVEQDVNSLLMEFCFPFNLIGLPALSVPCGLSGDGLPIGMQIVGRAFEESTVLRVGYSYERTTNWHAMFPEL